MDQEQEKEIARFFDCCETPGQRKANSRISRKARHELVKGIEHLGISGRTVLEVGCGPGDLTRELLQSGASKALGIDLAEKSLEVARKRAQKDGLADRAEFRPGNGAKDDLDQHDVVVLDKVICCYPDWLELVGNTSKAAKKIYGFVIPRSDGISGIVTRAFVDLQIFILKFRKCGFSPRVHDYDQIHDHLGGQGFSRTHLSRGPIWMTAVYSRA